MAEEPKPCYECGGIFVSRAIVADGVYKKFWVCNKCGKNVKDIDLADELKTGLIVECETIEDVDNEVKETE